LIGQDREGSWVAGSLWVFDMNFWLAIIFFINEVSGSHKEEMSIDEVEFVVKTIHVCKSIAITSLLHKLEPDVFTSHIPFDKLFWVSFE
jgi:hypothetical protein